MEPDDIFKEYTLLEEEKRVNTEPWDIVRARGQIYGFLVTDICWNYNNLLNEYLSMYEWYLMEGYLF